MDEQKSKSSAQKAIESYIEHEKIVHGIVKMGQFHGLDVEATDKNSSQGDIRVAKDDHDQLLGLIDKTIKKNRGKKFSG
ncbi:MAG: hypothetical protein B6247_27700 [Candidatus Parabeggiatoa sp. nov. 2]|nr:MAG: hypothetical protein B6247_27700 [Beggiatoa sp. 4572_84]